jgi:Periplasmic binding protein
MNVGDVPRGLVRGRPAASPRVPDQALARYPAASQPPRPHTAAELARLMGLLREAGAAAIAIGHGRHPASAAAAVTLAAAWTACQGEVVAVVDWPAAAASWLRPAQRLTAAQPDAWVLADTPAGCAQLAGRLAEQTSWTPARTVGFASVASPDLVALARPGSLAGLTGATASGGSWRIGHSLLVINDDPEGATP